MVVTVNAIYKQVADKQKFERRIMQERLAVSKKDSVIRKIVDSTYPGYKGRKIFLVSQSYPVNCASCWEGGSRSYFMFFNLKDFSTTMAPAQSAFDKTVKGLDSVQLIESQVIVEHCIFSGKDLGLRIYCTPEMYKELAKSVPVTATIG